MPPQNIKMSILVPVYNGARYLKSCLDSIVAQENKGFEVILCDDGSTDESSFIIDEYVHRHPFFKKVHRANSERGLFGNLNFLLSHVETPFIRVLCQDDTLLPECVGEEIDFLIAHPEVSVAYSAAVVVDQNSTKIEAPDIWRWPNIVRPGLAVQQFYFNGCLPGNLSTVCFRKSAVDKHGVFDVSFAVSADFDLWSRICETESLGVISKSLVCVRRHSGQLSCSKKSIIPFLVEDTKIRKRLKAHLPKEKAFAVFVYGTYIFGNARFKTVLDCLKKSEPLLFVKAVFYLGPLQFFLDAAVWLFSGGGRFFHPKPPFVLSQIEKEEHQESILGSLSHH